MDQDGVKTQIGFLCSLRFIREKITESEAAGYTAIKAMNAVQFIQSRLLDLKETGSTIADVALAKLDAVLGKNEGLRRVVRFANGESISEPADIEVFALAPCTTVDMERVFSVSSIGDCGYTTSSEKRINKKQRSFHSLSFASLIRVFYLFFFLNWSCIRNPPKYCFLA